MIEHGFLTGTGVPARTYPARRGYDPSGPRPFEREVLSPYGLG